MDLGYTFIGVILCFTMDIPKKVLSFPKNERQICLEQALQAHAMLADQNCPLQDLSNNHNGNNTCSVSCKAIYGFNNDLYDKSHCVEYKINFHYNEANSTQMTASLCDIKNCIIEYITIECWTQGNNTDQLNIFEHNKHNENECLGPGTIAALIVSCFVVGCLFGIGIIRVIYNFRNRQKDNRFPSTVSYQPSHQERSGLLEGRVIINPLEAEYADIEDHFRVINKAIQVPSYKEDSSSSSRSRENIYHHLGGLEERKSMGRDVSVFFSSDALAYSCKLERKESELQSGNSSLKSVIIHSGNPSLDSILFHADSSSIKSKDRSKTSPTGSAGSDKYFALEKEYLLIQNDNGCS